MNLPSSDDTIVAISTPPGYGGIGVVRISGARAFEIGTNLIREDIDFSEAEPNTLHYCHIVGDVQDRLIDEVVVGLFKGPRSYTGEDVIEISAHGNPMLLQQIVDLALGRGARRAEAGEFTLRAFMSGRIDLVQAEAVADLVSAAGELSQRSAIYQLTGGLSDFLSTLRAELLEIAALFEAYTDFPEEEIPAAEKSQLLDKLGQIENKLSRLAASYQHGKLIRSGIQIPIIGPANAGKSSLFNAILAEERAIVTEIPGTTRDTVSETISIGGLPVRFVDTAGLREAVDLIESMGVERSRREIAAASLLLAVFDITLLNGANSDKAAAELDSLMIDCADRNAILVLNKIDLVEQQDQSEIAQRFAKYKPKLISAKQLLGVDMLLADLGKWISMSLVESGDDNVLTNERHYRAVVEAATTINQVKEKLAEDVSFEFLAFDLRRAIEQLEEILGKITNEDMLSEIFSRFCIGK
jgi:tRNA modification GTPase